MTKLSAVIIANNEERYIDQCITSLQEITDDIVLVDSGSTDQTKTIARNLGARVYDKEFSGYGANKNYGNAKANNHWIISIDGDEILSPELIKTIKSLEPKSGHVYALNSLVNHSGKWVYHSGWYPRYKNRIFDRRECQWNSALVHEDLTPLKDKTIIKLPGDIHHYSYQNRKDHQARAHHYAHLKAREWHKSGKKIGKLKKVFGPAAAFFKTYILKQGFLDGEIGKFIAQMDAEMYRIAITEYSENNNA